jgi:hypothetical protein
LREAREQRPRIPGRFAPGDRVHSDSYEDPEDPSHNVVAKHGVVTDRPAHMVRWDEHPHALFAVSEGGLYPEEGAPPSSTQATLL